MTPKKKILILTTAYLPMVGGSELAIKELTERLEDFDFDLVTGRERRDLKISEVMGRIRVFRVGLRINFVKLIVPKVLLPLAIFTKALSLLRKNDYSAIHAFQASQAAGAAWLLKIFYPRLPLLLTIQEGKDLNSQNKLTQFFRKVIVRKADAITVISNYLGRFVSKMCPTLPVFLIPNGVNVSAFSVSISDESKQEFSKTLKIKHGDKVVISAGRLVEKNGLTNLVKAIGLLNRDIPVTLLLPGTGSLEGGLRKLAAELGLSDRVIFPGYYNVNDLPKFFSISDVFCRPSLSEGFGNSFLEAMAARVPVVASGVGGIPDFVQDHNTGLICDQNDPQSIAACLKALLTDEDLKKKVVQNAYDMTKSKYDWGVVAPKLREVYNKYAL